MLLYYLLLLSEESDKPLFIEMYEMYNVGLNQYAFALLHNQYDAEDATMAAWERVALNFTKPRQYFLESQKSFFVYARMIVKNLSLDEIKRKKRVAQVLENWDAPATDSTETQSAEHMMLDMLETMPEGLGYLLWTHLCENRSFKEIGKELGCKEDTARKRFNKAYDALKKRIDDAGY